MARPPIDVSRRTQAEPGRIGAIRGLAVLVDEEQQTEAFWRRTWADEIAARGERVDRGAR